MMLIFSFGFKNSYNWRDLQAHSVPLNITKLSDITRGPRIGPVGIIDDSLKLSEKNQSIMAPSEGKLDVPLKTNLSDKINLNDKKDMSDKPDISETKDTMQQLEESEKISNKDSEITETTKEKQDKLKPDNPLKPKTKNQTNSKLSKKIASNKKKSEKKDSKQEKFLEDILNKENVISKKTDNYSEKKKNIQAKESFLNSVLGDEEGKGSTESGGAQELGELSTSAIAALVEMIRPCWTITPLPGADQIVISLDVSLSKSGFVESVKVLNPRWSDPIYKTVANSATRALSDKRCQPFKLPVSEYSKWKRLKINFCPCELF